MKNEISNLNIKAAIGGDKAALEKVVVSVQNMVYNLSLRM